MAINRKALFDKAHFNARMKRLNGCPRAYRELFAECLKLAYADARRMAEWRANAAQREAMRDAQNVGFPLRSFRGERTFIRTSRNVAAIGA